MSAGPVSLESSIRTCKVDVAYANKMESDRFLNPSNAMCPRWTGKDLMGRKVCANSFKTKSAGCNSAVDRVHVENDLRPQYSEYINLSTMGLKGKIYNDPSLQSGGFGQDIRNKVYHGCNRNPYAASKTVKEGFCKRKCGGCKH
jgi:hypothetical protein